MAKFQLQPFHYILFVNVLLKDRYSIDYEIIFPLVSGSQKNICKKIGFDRYFFPIAYTNYMNASLRYQFKENIQNNEVGLSPTIILP